MGKSPSSGRRGRGPGAETRLDRLVRRPSMEGGKPVPPPTSGIPVLKGNHPRAKPRQVAPPTPPNNNEVIETCFQVDEDEQEEEEEPLYDTVANDIAEDEYYDLKQKHDEAMWQIEDPVHAFDVYLGQVRWGGQDAWGVQRL